MKLDILYRGPLASCNYGCDYCPFAKRKDDRAALDGDRAAWQRFCDWLAARPATDQLGVLVTPWGEAMIRRWYQAGFARLSRLPQISRIAAQTNLSGSLDWLARCDPGRVALWCTYHPAWTPHDEFLAKCRELDAAGVRYSVGIVGQREHHAAAVAMRAALPESIYVWINAVKALGYAADEIAAWRAIDPLFELNTQRYASMGRACGAGERAITVDGDGAMRRCHFISATIGNIYDADWAHALQPRACTQVDCHCHIGYVHLDYLELDKVYAGGLLERVPVPEARAGGARLPII
ncbi:MAG TPA: STM4011 family radical SAM protein [Kofleriaceae bacterium]|jgi:MoaA/NifB/PqqE/SkfB family radical SAM enzyme|nr:STM4011 family radical SAM protein [Kofleriaceae bacterium]